MDSVSTSNEFFCQTCKLDLRSFVEADEQHQKKGHLVRTKMTFSVIIDGMPRGLPFFEWKQRPWSAPQKDFEKVQAESPLEQGCDQ